MGGTEREKEKACVTITIGKKKGLRVKRQEKLPDPFNKAGLNGICRG